MKHLHLLEKLLAIDSPSGFTGKAEEFIISTLKSMGYEPRVSNKGAVICSLGDSPTVGIAAHTDTLGAVVSGVNSNGTLKFSLLGGPLLPSFEGSYVRIHTRKGKIYAGTLLLNNPSVHANKLSGKTERTTDEMHIRVDELVENADDVKGLGIGTGDIVAFDTKYQALENGFIKSHFLDNKAGCFVLFLIALQVKELGISPPVELFFSNYEEVGHGGATGYSSLLTDLLVIDMGVIGDQLDGRETLCSICAKDSGGPYDYNFRKTLVELAELNSIPHAVDVYPFYSSDGTAAWRAGLDARVALIGPGVAASHGMERTHVAGIQATVDLSMAFIKHHFN
ncbi:MAG: M42 family metallopeptidase [Ignavibacteria bacterium]|nr:M42 family metallopeptidase [Ignavibacteria bacterium]